MRAVFIVMFSSGCAHIHESWDRARYDGSLACVEVMTRTDPEVSPTTTVCLYSAETETCSCSVRKNAMARLEPTSMYDAIAFPASPWIPLSAGLSWPNARRERIQAIMEDLR